MTIHGYKEIKDCDIPRRNWLNCLLSEENVCRHTKCASCNGSGIKKNGTSCAHMMSCRCSSCSPARYMLNLKKENING